MNYRDFYYIVAMRFVIIILISGIVLLSGCGSGSPRFSKPEREARETDETQTGIRFARQLERAAKEERAEDDVKVDVEAVENRLTSAPVPGSVVLPTARQTTMLREILKHIGTPYRLGGTTAEGIDCSAYIALVYRNALKIDLPRTTRHQFGIGRSVGRNDMQFGDLIFFNTTGSNPSHVGIYIGDNLFAHASVSYGVTISSLQSSYFQKRLTDIRRILD